MAERDYLTTRDFLSARDFFETVRGAVLEGERAQRQIEAMRAGEGIRSASLFGGRGGGRDASGMARVDARIDLESVYERRIAEAKALVAAARDVIYGRDQEPGGVAALVGPVAADALFWRFCKAESWHVVTDSCGVSESTCRRMVDVGIDAVQAYGISRAIAGVGVAEG